MTITYTLEDKTEATIGDTVYDYYSLCPVKIIADDGDGWFETERLDGSRGPLLNGERTCSMTFAAKKGWVDKLPAKLLTVWTKVEVIVPADRVDEARAVIDAAIDFGTVRDSIEGAFDGAPMPMQIHSLTVPDEFVAVTFGDELFGPGEQGTHLVDRFVEAHPDARVVPLAPIPHLETPEDLDA